MSIEVMTPPYGTENYLSYVKRLGSVCLATEALDNSIRAAQRTIATSGASRERVEQLMSAPIAEAQTTLNRTNPLNTDISLNDYFRLMSHIRYAHELVLANQVYVTNDQQERARLADGLSGVASELVDSAIDMFEHVRRNDRTKQREARGVINEFSAIALANLAEDGTVLMLPSSQYADLYASSDAVYYNRQSLSKKQYVRTNIQIKSSRKQRSGKRSNSQEAVYVYANDFGNTDGSISVSKLLVSAMNGTSDTDDAWTTLAEQSKQLKASINSQRNELNTTPLHQMTVWE